MYVRIDEGGSLQAFEEMLGELQSREDVNGVLVLSCDGNAFEPDDLSPVLQQCAKPVFGGLFPAVLHGRRKLERGTVMVGIPCRCEYMIKEDLDAKDNEVFLSLIRWAKSFDPPRTLISFCDALSGGADRFSEALASVFGLDANCIGGGAGSLNFRGKPCIITNKGLLQDSAVLVASSMESGVSARHGWHPLEGPFTVTDVSGCWLRELDGKPAFEVYRKLVEAHSGMKFGMESFFDMARAYPFGIPTLRSEHLVRDPLAMREDGSMLLAGEVKDGTQLDLLTGNRRSMLHAAERAHWHARHDLKPVSGESITLIMDCISRVLFLEESFDEELAALDDGLTKLVGACSIGEFAGNGKDYLSFFNKSVVVGILKGFSYC
ncbi:FIST signal transduction protein [Salidesulfovibrio onnuriiensis]|uniref:FIST signal transduction protein n=1 Tax=Salidesulfovibrio onnuriiensis TaxID=2583823 RepID=UPI0011CA2325|nr:FIST C-terminal domain-containing protein [Salidesulfovibrio onnuriiensis]